MFRWFGRKNPTLIESKRGNSSQAIALLTDAIRHHDRDPAFHQSLGDILYQLERYPEAAGDYEAALKLKRNAEWDVREQPLYISHSR